MAFADQLRAWRKKKGLSQRALDKAIGGRQSFTSNIESGLVKPPPYQACMTLGEALGVPGELVWQAARGERLRALDEELWAYYEGEGATSRARSLDLSYFEAELVQYLRWLDEEFPEETEPPLAAILSTLALTLMVDDSEGDTRKASPLAPSIVEAFRNLTKLHPRPQRHIMTILSRTIMLAAEEEEA